MFKFAKKKEKEREFMIKLVEEIGTLKLQNSYLYEEFQTLKNKMESFEQNLDIVHDEYTQIKGMIYTGRV